MSHDWFSPLLVVPGLILADTWRLYFLKNAWVRSHDRFRFISTICSLVMGGKVAGWYSPEWGFFLMLAAMMLGAARVLAGINFTKSAPVIASATNRNDATPCSPELREVLEDRDLDTTEALAPLNAFIPTRDAPTVSPESKRLEGIGSVENQVSANAVQADAIDAPNNGPASDKVAYAVGLLGKDPSVSWTDLGKQVGVSRKTIYEWMKPDCKDKRFYKAAKAIERLPERGKASSGVAKGWKDKDGNIDAFDESDDDVGEPDETA